MRLTSRYSQSASAFALRCRLELPGSLRLRSSLSLLFAVLLLCAVLSAQEPPKPAVISPHARLMAARSIFIEHAGGLLPNDVIGDAFQGWGRYTVVGDPAKADLIVSINAPVSDSGVSVGGGSGHGRLLQHSLSSSDGHPDTPPHPRCP